MSAAAPRPPSPASLSSRLIASPMYFKTESRSKSSDSSSSASSGRASQGYETAPPVPLVDGDSSEHPVASSSALPVYSSPPPEVQADAIAIPETRGGQGEGVPSSSLPSAHGRRPKKQTSVIPLCSPVQRSSSPGYRASNRNSVGSHASSSHSRNTSSSGDPYNSFDDNEDNTAVIMAQFEARISRPTTPGRSHAKLTTVSYPLPSPTHQSPFTYSPNGSPRLRQARLSSEFGASTVVPSPPRLRTNRIPRGSSASPRRTPQPGSPLNKSRSSLLPAEPGSPRSSRLSSPSGSLRTRTSHATSLGPFDYDGSSSNSETETLERDFLAAIERRQSAMTGNSDLAMRLSLPVTARSRISSLSGMGLDGASQTSSPTTPVVDHYTLNQTSVPDSPGSAASNDRNIFRGSKYESTWSAASTVPPVVRSNPASLSPRVRSPSQYFASALTYVP